MRAALVDKLRAEGISDEHVLHAIATVPRHLFVDQSLQEFAYADDALPIDCGQTISQPFVVALMTQMLLAGQEKMTKVLEIGTGSGYQAAVLAQLVNEVYTIERIATLLNQAKHRFQELKITNIQCQHSDGFLGWPQHSPYDGIIVTAATPEIPPVLLEQLSDGGRMVVPVGVPFATQQLCVITRDGNHFAKEYFDYVLFVPLRKGTT